MVMELQILVRVFAVQLYEKLEAAMAMDIPDVELSRSWNPMNVL